MPGGEFEFRETAMDENDPFRAAVRAELRAYRRNAVRRGLRFLSLLLVVSILIRRPWLVMISVIGIIVGVIRYRRLSEPER